MVFTDISFAEDSRNHRPHIECDSHGQGYQAFVCEHLMVNPNQEWFSDDPTTEDPWPDAWCKECQAVFEEQGEWNDENSFKLRVKVVCHHCYEVLRLR